MEYTGEVDQEGKACGWGNCKGIDRVDGDKEIIRMQYEGWYHDDSPVLCK